MNTAEPQTEVYVPESEPMPQGDVAQKFQVTGLSDMGRETGIWAAEMEELRETYTSFLSQIEASVQRNEQGLEIL